MGCHTGKKNLCMDNNIVSLAHVGNMDEVRLMHLQTELCTRKDLKPLLLYQQEMKETDLRWCYLAWPTVGSCHHLLYLKVSEFRLSASQMEFM